LTHLDGAIPVTPWTFHPDWSVESILKKTQPCDGKVAAQERRMDPLAYLAELLNNLI
jgi:hypothetical protein